MKKMEKNIFANFGSKIFLALMSLAFVPIYIKFLGMESYGLIGFFMSIQAFFSLMDMGLSTALNREIARLSISERSEQEMRDLVRTLEVVYWGIGIFIVLIIVGLSEQIAQYWLNFDQFSKDDIRQIIIIMGFAIAVQWPSSLYSGGLMGLQRQVLLSFIDVIVVIIKGLGSVMILWLISPTIQAFFLWQVLAGFFSTIFFGTALWRSLPPSDISSSFRFSLLSSIWGFSAGMMLVSLTSVVLSQIDKIILSKVLSLEMFGYYALASVVANTLSYFIVSIFNALFPRFSQLVKTGNLLELELLYHKGCQLMSVVVFSTSSILFFFSFEILSLWINNITTVENTYLLVSILVVSRALSSLIYMPAALQYAHSWTALITNVNILSIIFFGVFSYILGGGAIAIDVAILLLIVNFIRLVVIMPIMHRRLLRDQKIKWFVYDVALPGLISAGVTWFLYLLLPNNLSRVGLLIGLIFISSIVILATLFSTKVTRNWLILNFSLIKRKAIKDKV